jgi:hypothetical protein
VTRLRAEMRRPFELAARRRLARAYFMRFGIVAPIVIAACYSTGDGTAPPPATFYFPVGLTVSKGGNVLYVANSDFDLQWNGGTIQSYDLHQIRIDATISAAGYSLSSQLPFPEGGGLSEFVEGGVLPEGGVNPCFGGGYIFLPDGGLISPCAPYIDSSSYVRDSVTIGAFATDIQLSPTGNRLYAPVRGDASLTWLTVTSDKGVAAPSKGSRACDGDAGAGDCYEPFTLHCGQQLNGGRCDATHHAGVNPFEPGNTRNLTMPGEPFAMAQTDDGTAIVLTHQSENDTSLFLTGLSPDGGNASPSTPSMQYIIDAGIPLGGDGIGTIPHDPHAYGCETAENCPAFPRPSFMETNNTAPVFNIVRYYSDDGTSVVADAGFPDANLPVGTTLQRPFLELERTVSITALALGTDSRGIVFDTSARLKCETNYPFPDVRNEECARVQARVFTVNRTPNTLLVGTAGGANATDPTAYDYDADLISITAGKQELSAGASRVYLAPIIDADGDYSLRVFVVCFDGNAIDIVNPVTQVREATITVGAGPFAMAFDQFDPLDVAFNRQVNPAGEPAPTFAFTPDKTTKEVQLPLPKYRYAYVASFTNSYVQVIDLDNFDSKSTFETVVYTLGTPTVPKGNQ